MHTHSSSKEPAEPAGTRPVIQLKLSVGAENGILEQEADTVADRVMRMPDPAFIQRKCAACEDEEEKLQRKPMTPFIQKMGSDSGVTAGEGISSAIQSARGSGNSMSANTKSFMESRFGADFTQVKIHTGEHAVQMSRELNAQAFTVGKDIFFNSGKYNPAEESGRHLLAHELTHTLQQGNGIERQIQRAGETGTSVYEERVSSTVTSTATPGVTTGTVERSEYRNAADQAAGNYYHRANVDVVFDENNCTITVPHRVQFVNHSAANPTTCGDIHGRVTDPVRPVSAATLRSVANNFLRANNEGLNGWFRLRLTNAPNHRCNDKNIPVVVQVVEVTSNPDTTVIVTANSGRSYVSGDARRNRCVLCNNPGYGVLVHEAGHMTLGHGDEYSERSDGPAERERLTDYSTMAQAGPQRLQVFHERHFEFIPAFIRHIIPGCTASLIYGDRPRYTPAFYPSFAMGGISGRFGGPFINLGLDMGIPLDALRRTEILLGPRLTGILAFDDNYQSLLAVLYGIRLTYTGTFNTTLFNRQLPVGVGLHTEFGAGHNFGDAVLPRDFSYMEVGGSLGFRPITGSVPILKIDTGVGALDLGSPTSIPFFRLGISVGGTF